MIVSVLLLQIKATKILSVFKVGVLSHDNTGTDCIPHLRIDFGLNTISKHCKFVGDTFEYNTSEMKHAKVIP